MQKEAQSRKYSNLEISLGKLTQSLDRYHSPKLTVIMERKSTPMLRVNSQIVVSRVQELDEKSKDELESLYSNMIAPMGNWMNLLWAVAGSENGSREDYLRGFMGSFAEKIKENNLEDKTNIKRIIIYPLLIAELNDIGKHDCKSSRYFHDVIDSMKAAEPNDSLKEAIEMIRMESAADIPANSLIRS